MFKVKYCELMMSSSVIYTIIYKIDNSLTVMAEPILLGLSDKMATKSSSAPCFSNEVSRSFISYHSDGNAQVFRGFITDSREFSIDNYGEEPFETFQEKVRNLLSRLWPWLPSSNYILERIKGGGYNRIVSIKVFEDFLEDFTAWDKRQGTASSYILRIPRYAFLSDVQYEVTILKFASRHINHKVPKVIQFDTSDRNPLGRTWMLQERLPGRPLCNLYGFLNIEQKQSAVRCVSALLLDIFNITSKYAGIISKKNTDYDFVHEVKVNQILVPWDLEGGVPDANPAVPQTTRDFLLSLCRRQYDVHRSDNNHEYNSVWNGFETVIDKMSMRGFLPVEDSFHFCHGDFQPRNILVEIVDDSSIRITGIIDWDRACFGPKFVATTSPYFFWAHHDSREDEEEQALYVPTMESKATLKRIYEESVGSEFLRASYDPVYVLARKMYQILRSGIDEERLSIAKTIIQKLNERLS